MDSKPAFTIVCRDLARQMDHGINYLDTLGPRPRLWLGRPMPIILVTYLLSSSLISKIFWSVSRVRDSQGPSGRRRCNSRGERIPLPQKLKSRRVATKIEIPSSQRSSHRECINHRSICCHKSNPPCRLAQKQFHQSPAH